MPTFTPNSYGLRALVIGYALHFGDVPAVQLALGFGRFDQFDASGLVQLAGGGVGEGFLLHGGVDNDTA
jgi:hypothetical protein